MFCPNCGTPITDGTRFCTQCGFDVTSEAAQPSQPMYQQPAQPAYQQPSRPTYQQPPQPTYQQPMNEGYAPPYNANVAVKTKSKAVPIIIISVAVVAVAAFLIVLFTVIIPNSGLSGKIKHKWAQESDGVTVIWDYNDSVMYLESLESLRIPFKWELKGNHLTLSMESSLIDVDEKGEFTVSFSTDGKTMTLEEDGGYSTETFKRAD